MNTRPSVFQVGKLRLGWRSQPSGGAGWYSGLRDSSVAMEVEAEACSCLEAPCPPLTEPEALSLGLALTRGMVQVST